MYRYVYFHVNSILLNIIIPPATPTSANKLNVSGAEGRIMIKFISMNEEKEGSERSKYRSYNEVRYLWLLSYLGPLGPRLMRP